MIKVEVIEEFTLGKFNELRNLVRSNPNKKEIGRLYVKDTFECDEEMADYLGGNNAIHRAVIKAIEVIPDEVNEEATEPKKKTAKRKTTTKKK